MENLSRHHPLPRPPLHQSPRELIDSVQTRVEPLTPPPPKSIQQRRISYHEIFHHSFIFPFIHTYIFFLTTPFIIHFLLTIRRRLGSEISLQSLTRAVSTFDLSGLTTFGVTVLITHLSRTIHKLFIYCRTSLKSCFMKNITILLVINDKNIRVESIEER